MTLQRSTAPLTILILQIKPLIWVQATVESHKHSRVEYLIKTRAQFKARSIANNVVITIPVPPDADTPQFHANVGTVEYVPAKDAILWTIKQFGGGKEFALRAHFGLPSIEAGALQRLCMYIPITDRLNVNRGTSQKTSYHSHV